MIKAIEVLLCAWGREAVSPAIDVSIASPLGRMDEDAPSGQGGSRCLSTVECWVAMSRAAQAVDRALHDLALDTPHGLGAIGRTMVQLALVRYCQPRPLLVAEQARRLGVSPRTYRTRVDELHVELARTLPGVAAGLGQVEQQLPANVAREERERQAAKVSRVEQRELERRVARWLMRAAS
jgi:hypothetical protein